VKRAKSCPPARRLMNSLKDKLSKHLPGNLAIVGLGNILKADDGVGCRLVHNLQGKIKAALFDAGTTPENQLGPIMRSKPDTVLVVDALHTADEPGNIKLFKAKKFVTTALTTHGLNLEFFVNYLKEHGISNVVFLGIQPVTVEFSDELSAPVQKALEKLEDILQSSKC
jgi:hydrogenase 3 maturation protease